MELKLRTLPALRGSNFVLIVLYGIETYMKFQLESFFYRLNRTLWN